MLDKFVEKLMQNASSYFPNMAAMTEGRAKELEIIRSKVRSSPQEVEAWFDSEIDKIRNLSMNDVIDMAKDRQSNAEGSDKD